MPARSVCLVTLSLSEAGPGRFGCQISVTDIYHIIPSHLSGSIYAFRFDISVIAKYDARAYWFGLYWVLSSFFDLTFKV